jgi:flagellar biosynthesis protein FliQ
MLPALTLVFKTIEDRWGKKGRIFTLVILVSLLIGIWLLFLFTIEGNQEHPSVYLPLPILSFVTLLWMRSWVTRQTPLFEEKF